MRELKRKERITQLNQSLQRIYNDEEDNYLETFGGGDDANEDFLSK